MQIINHKTTAYGDELTEVLPVKKNAALGITPVFELLMPNVLAGDIMSITAKAQVTNNLHQAPWSTTQNNVGVGCALAYIDALGAFQPITFWTGGNVDARQHHATRLDATSWTVPVGVSGTVAIRFYLKSAALQAKASWSLRIDRGYGNMAILHLRP